MRLSQFTMLAFEINAVWDMCPDFELSFGQVHEAARQRGLVSFLAERFGDDVDLSLLTSNAKDLPEIETALQDAACALEGRESRKVGVKTSGLCLSMAIVIEAIQQQFCHLLR